MQDVANVSLFLRCFHCFPYRTSPAATTPVAWQPSAKATRRSQWVMNTLWLWLCLKWVQCLWASTPHRAASSSTREVSERLRRINSSTILQKQNDSAYFKMLTSDILHVKREDVLMCPCFCHTTTYDFGRSLNHSFTSAGEHTVKVLSWWLVAVKDTKRGNTVCYFM